MTSSKKELKEKENQQRLARAIETLDSITRNSDIQKSIRNMIKEVLLALRDERRSLSVQSCKCNKPAGQCNSKPSDAITHPHHVVAGSLNSREHKGIASGCS